MATRNSREEAEKVKNELEQQHPSIEVRIIDAGEETWVGSAVAEREGLEILEDGGVMVKAFVPRFDILEVRSCRRCGNEILTAAIGEIGLNECPDCRIARQSRQQATDEKSRKAQADHLAWGEFHDEVLNA